MFDEYLEPPHVERPISPAPAVQVPVNSVGTPSSTTIDQDAPSLSHSPSSSTLQSPSLHQDVAAESTFIKDNLFSAESTYVSQTLHHLVTEDCWFQAMQDEIHESDEFIKSSVKNLVLNPSEFEDEHECDVPVCDDFTTFSNLLFDADDDFSSSDGKSFSDENIPKEIYSNPLFYEEIISIKIDPHHFNAESDLIESLLNHDSLIISSSSKINSLLDEFASDSFFSNQFHRGLMKPTVILRKKFDSDSLIEEIDLSFTPDDSMPPGIENDDYESEGDMFILEELLSNDSLLLLENESFHFDIPSSPRPFPKPSDDDEIEPNSGILTVKVVGDISEQYVPIPRLLPSQNTLASNQEISPHLLSQRGLKSFQLSSKNPMMIHGENIPILDVPFLYFYPP
nr:hypothetical protein [Tanacetum cinerariifolium]